jgi:formyl-CoA transferase
VIEVADADLGTLPMPGVVPRLARTPGSVRWSGPRLGHHTHEVLEAWLGLEREAVDELMASGVAGPVEAGEPGDGPPEAAPGRR